MDENNLVQDILPKRKSKKRVIGGLILGAIPLLFIVYLVLGPLLHILSKDLAAEEMFVISEWVNVRATADLKSLKMGTVNYGTKVLVYEIKDDWAEVLIDGQKGYVSEKFLASPQVYYTIEGLYGNKRAEKALSNTKYRLALYRYLQEKGFTTDIPKEIKAKFFNEEKEKEVFQIYAEPAGSKFNSVVYADFNGDYKEDGAFILKNKLTDRKILVIISLDKNDPLNISKVIYEQELEQPWYFIKIAGKGYRYYTTDTEKKIKLPLNGILIGSNRDKKLNDPEFLLLYNGETFDLYEQPNK